VRVRHNGDKRVQTIKSGGLANSFKRGEWEQEIKGDFPNLRRAISYLPRRAGLPPTSRRARMAGGGFRAIASRRRRQFLPVSEPPPALSHAR
jgi:hypothetical protein